jgi:hypothetical protein
MDSKIRARLDAFAESLNGPLGSVPLDRAIRANLALFRELRRSGTTWPQIARALATVGARRADGSLITPDHVRSAVTRQLKRTLTEEHKQQPPDTSVKYQPPELSISTPASAPNNQRNHPLSEQVKLKGKSVESLKNNRSHTADDLGNRNKAILDILARTRKLRES